MRPSWNVGAKPERFVVVPVGRMLSSGSSLSTSMQLEAAPKARAFFEEQSPYYKRVTAFWVMSAKKEETRARRMALLVAHSRKGERIPALASPSKAKTI